MRVRAVRGTVAALALVLLVWGAVGCTDDGGTDIAGADPPGQSVDVGELYGQGTGETDAGVPTQGSGVAAEEATASSSAAGTDPATAPASPQPTGPPPPPTSGVDAGVPYGAHGELVQGADEMFSLTDAEVFTLDQAQALIMTECLAEEGYEDVVDGPTMPTPGSGVAEVDETMGLIRGESAGFGYHGDPSFEYFGTEGWGVRGGVPKGESGLWDAQSACYTVINKTLGLPGEERLPWTIKHAAEADAATDSDFLKAVDDWSACMARDGYDYNHPSEPWLDPAWGWPDCEEGTTLPECTGEVEMTRPELTDIEIATAQADIACKAEVNMVPIYRAAMWASQEERIAANRPALEERLATEKSRLDRAQEVIAGDR